MKGVLLCVGILLTFIAIGQCDKSSARFKRSRSHNIMKTGPSPEEILEKCLVKELEETETEMEVFYETTTTSNLNGSDDNATLVPDGFYDRFSDEFLSCQTVGISPECYHELENGSVSVPVYSMIFNDSDYYISENKELNVCPAFFDKINFKFSDALSIVSNVAVGVSTFCVLLHMAMFVAIKKLRNLPGYCLFSLCIALLVAYTCFFLPVAIPEESSCSEVGMVMSYFFLSAFFWMNAMSYDVWRSLRLATAKLRLTGDRKMLTRFLMYSLYSWGVPLLLYVIAILINYSSSVDEKYKLKFNEDNCWFQYKQALGVYFAFPLFSLLCINILFFMSSSFMISSATIRSSENKVFLWSRFFVTLRLAVVMGLTWIFGVLATATQQPVLWYFYSIFTALQGLFIFFSFTLTDKTRKACRKIMKGKKSLTSVAPTCSSQQATSFQQGTTSTSV